jgi:hypothetical protein
MREKVLRGAVAAVFVPSAAAATLFANVSGVSAFETVLAG